MVPDSTLNAAFFILAKCIWQENANDTIDLLAIRPYVPIAQITFSTMQNRLGRLGRSCAGQRMDPHGTILRGLYHDLVSPTPSHPCVQTF
jgi:hypothetical protein